MIYLLWAILLSGMVSMVFKFIEKKDCEGDYVTWVNYLFAASFSLVRAFQGGLAQQWGKMAQCTPSTLLTQKTVPNTLLLLTVLGAVSGICYLASLLLIRVSIAKNGLSITTIFGKFSFAFTAVFTLLLWREFPQGLGAVGFAIAVVGLLLMSGRRGAKEIQSVGVLFGLALINSTIEMFSKLFVQYGIERYKDLMVFTIFGSAAVYCTVYVALQLKKKTIRRGIRLRDILAGVAVGLPNVLTTTVQMRALERLPAAVVFSSISVGVLFLTVLVGRFVFKEKITRRQALCSLLAFAGVVLINL
ncbi:EamA family transporter [Neobittarella massiliensis]|uniref:EamA family transporter n=1 Tax=Neobittarella massiliensis (ex Bilen et al. 2018) TaxID=2041842 RepID=A0A8J6IRP1_9FIRM|nr:EamA family transporter [Neobittarella massiliensis]MBC3517238.1 EamA family transporter [Neobittarella massiliensis]